MKTPHTRNASEETGARYLKKQRNANKQLYTASKETQVGQNNSLIYGALYFTLRQSCKYVSKPITQNSIHFWVVCFFTEATTPQRFTSFQTTGGGNQFAAKLRAGATACTSTPDSTPNTIRYHFSPLYCATYHYCNLHTLETEYFVPRTTYFSSTPSTLQAPSCLNRRLRPFTQPPKDSS